MESRNPFLQRKKQYLPWLCPVSFIMLFPIHTLRNITASCFSKRSGKPMSLPLKHWIKLSSRLLFAFKFLSPRVDIFTSFLKINIIDQFIYLFFCSWAIFLDCHLIYSSITRIDCRQHFPKRSLLGLGSLLLSALVVIESPDFVFMIWVGPDLNIDLGDIMVYGRIKLVYGETCQAMQICFYCYAGF